MKPILPKPRNQVDLRYYTLGETGSKTSPQRFIKHQAEPSVAASILDRNPHHTETVDIKPSTDRASSVSERYNASITTISTLKQVQSRQYANKAGLPSIACAKTVDKKDFTPQTNIPTEVPLSENWLYCTRSKPYTVKPEETFRVSDQSPDWFRSSKSNDKSLKDDTVTLFSRLSGWIYVSGESRNRKHRLGKHEPLKESEKYNQNVSNLAPVWMQRESPSLPDNKLKAVKPPPNLRQEQKRMIIVDDQLPEKSIFSIGDFRHDIRTSDEVATYNRTALNQPKKFLDWKEDTAKQSYDKPVSDKVGSRRN